MPFYRRRWDESRGDHYDDWGPATSYFWTHDGVIEQQVEVHDSGVMLAYDRYHPVDEFGQLTVEPLDVAVWTPFEIDLADYQRAVDGQPLNRKGHNTARARLAPERCSSPRHGGVGVASRV